MVSMVYKIPSYRISDLEIKLIFDPKYGIPSDILTLFESENLRMVKHDRHRNKSEVLGTFFSRNIIFVCKYTKQIDKEEKY